MLDKAAAQAKQAPSFEVDPFWPKPMPKNWVLRSDHRSHGRRSDDHVWMIHRGNDPGSGLDRTELGQPTAGGPRVSECCNPAPPVLEFDAGRQPVGSWGGPGGGRAVPVARERTTASWSTTRASCGSAATASLTRTS